MKENEAASSVRLLYMSTAELKPATRNPKEHATEEIAESVRRFGFIDPLVMNEASGQLVAGHGRLEVLEKMRKGGEPPPERVKVKGRKWLVPVVRGVSFENEAEAEAYLLASNQLTTKGGWSDEGLRDVLQSVTIDTEAALQGTGFTDKDLRKLVQRTMPTDGAGSEPSITDRDEPLTQPGDIIELGNHVLFCGSCTELPAHMAARGVVGKLLLTDPPYGVDYASSQKHRKAATGANNQTEEIKGDTDPAKMGALWASWFKALAQCLQKGAALYVFGPQNPSLQARLTMALEGANFYLPQQLIWVKNNANMGRTDYHGRHEPITYGWLKGAGHHQLTDRKQETVWNFDRPQKVDLHPTMKPVDLLQRAVLNSSDLGAWVVDGFGGSGSTLIACEREGRRCFMSEVSPLYCDRVVARWEAETGKSAKRPR
jgi:DNA modification methylase